EKICIAIDWMSLADLSNIPMSFLQAMIALETILEIKSNSISIVSQISMSIYTLLGTNIEDKKKLNAFMKQSYDVRSNIVHNGRAEVAEDMYFELCKIIFQLIYKIGVDNELTKLKDTEDLWKYVELQLMQ
ncbi:HEPN domain-containing protein, partial [Lactobacillus crispatus]